MNMTLSKERIYPQDHGDDKGQDYYILSVDGGGMRGVYAAHLLQLIESEILKKQNKSLFEQFDLFAGTSTGAIIAAGLAAAVSSQEIVNIYDIEGPIIFAKRPSETISSIREGLNASLGLQIFRKPSDTVPNQATIDPPNDKPDPIRKALIFIQACFEGHPKPQSVSVEKLWKESIPYSIADNALDALSLVVDPIRKFIDILLFLCKKTPFHLTAPLEAVLKGQLRRNQPNGDLLTFSNIHGKGKRLIITAYDATNDDDFIFDSTVPQHPATRENNGEILSQALDTSSVKLFKAVLCSSAAPFFFNPVQITQDRTLVDGGVVANNPTMVAIARHIREQQRSQGDINLSRIKVLSIGTGTPESKLPHEKPGGLNLIDKLMAITDILSIFTDGHSDSTDLNAQDLLPYGHYIRLNCPISAVNKDINDATEANRRYLKQMAHNTFTANEAQLSQFFTAVPQKAVP